MCRQQRCLSSCYCSADYLKRLNIYHLRWHFWFFLFLTRVLTLNSLHLGEFTIILHVTRQYFNIISLCIRFLRMPNNIIVNRCTNVNVCTSIISNDIRASRELPKYIHRGRPCFLFFFFTTNDWLMVCNDSYVI